MWFSITKELFSAAWADMLFELFLMDAFRMLLVILSFAFVAAEFLWFEVSWFHFLSTVNAYSG